MVGIIFAMTTTESPLAVFLKWFEACPARVQEHISDFAIMHAPKLFSRQEGQPSSPAVLEVLRQANDTFSWESVGHLLFMITVTEFTFVGKNSAAALSHERQVVEAARERLREENREEALGHIIKEMAEKASSEQMLWQQWDELRSGILSLEGIRQWESKTTAALSRQQMSVINEGVQKFQDALDRFKKT
ncbi:hypothetical protein [Myxococcus faecalis]|uniref:hypothetical protein n=1 Tax=Myxococcus faecalis TaxID=3115646 RepID=UPI003CFA208F